MDLDLISFTSENLNSLKFNDLQKLSSKYHVNKRWAKKREIIDKLLSLRDQEIEKKKLLDNAGVNINSQDNVQWIEGKKAFSSVEAESNSNNENIDRRLTYCIRNCADDSVDRRLTFNVVKKEENLIARDVNLEISDAIDRRLTYNADEMKALQKSLKNAMKNLKTESITEDVEVLVSCEKDPNIDATSAADKKENQQPKKHMSQLSAKSALNYPENHTTTNNKEGKGVSNNQTKKSADTKPVKAKMLTIPVSRIPSHRKSAVREVKPCDDAKKKQPENVIPVNGLNKSRAAVNKLPGTLQEQDPHSKMKLMSLTKSLNGQGNGLSTSKQNSCSSSIKSESIMQNCTRRVLPRRKSKTEDNVLVTNLKSKKNLKFYSPTQADLKNTRRISGTDFSRIDVNFESKIPKAKPIINTQKPLTAKKMPDFSKIHQKHFEQMDSLLDYKRKKEERAKKLFGISHSNFIDKVNKGNNSTIFQFKSTNQEKENILGKTISGASVNTIKTDAKQNTVKTNRRDVMNHTRSTANIVKNVKEQNRKLVNGVRTNKRFELQMQFRKI